MESLNIPGITSTIERRVENVDTEALDPVVRSVLDDKAATVTQFERTPIRGGAGGGYFGTALFRYRGTAQSSRGQSDWSVILKVLAEREGERPESHPYWKREAEAYRAKAFRAVPGSLVPARAHQIDEYPGEAVWLWLEDLTDDYGGNWPREQYRRAARHLGQFNGAFLTGTEIPAEPWVIERTFDFSRTASTVAFVDRVPDDPIGETHFPTEADRQRLFDAWQAREEFVEARAALPETVCHFDAFERNLFAVTDENGESRTVAIDWDQCGIARLGDDGGALVVLTLMFLDWPVKQAWDLEAAVLEGYLRGLRDAGWEGSTELVERGIRLHIIIRWLEWVGVALRLTLDESAHDWVEEIVGAPFDTMMEGNRDLHRYAFETIDRFHRDLSATP